MRSREPWRLPAGQSRAVPFLQAAVLFAALCIFARSAALVLAAFLAAPVPAAQTLLHLGQQAVESRAAATSAESVPEEIGREFSGRDHSTIVYSLKTMERDMKNDQHLRETVSDIIKNVKA